MHILKRAIRKLKLQIAFANLGATIHRLTTCKNSVDGEDGTVVAADKTAMVRAARQLLSAITKVLLLADKVVVKQLLASKDKVMSVLQQTW